MIVNLWVTLGIGLLFSFERFYELVEVTLAIVKRSRSNAVPFEKLRDCFAYA
jgi:hypothetical protein